LNLNCLIVLNECNRLANTNLNLLKGSLWCFTKKNSLRKKSCTSKNTLNMRKIMIRNNKVTGLIMNLIKFESET